MPELIIYAKGVSATNPDGILFYVRDPDIDLTSERIRINFSRNVLDSQLFLCAQGLELQAQGCRIVVRFDEVERVFDYSHASIQEGILNLGSPADVEAFCDCIRDYQESEAYASQSSEGTAETEPSSPVSFFNAASLLYQRAAGVVRVGIQPLETDEEANPVESLARANAGI